MNPIEKEYNKRFKDKELSDKAFDSEKLWASITEGIQEKPVVDPSPIGNSIVGGSSKTWLLFMLSIGIVATSLTYYFINSKQYTSDNTNTIVTEKTTKPVPQMGTKNANDRISDTSTKSSLDLTNTTENPINKDIVSIDTKKKTKKSSDNNSKIESNRFIDKKPSDVIEVIDYSDNARLVISQVNESTIILEEKKDSSIGKPNELGTALAEAPSTKSTLPLTSQTIINSTSPIVGDEKFTNKDVGKEEKLDTKTELSLLPTILNPVVLDAITDDVKEEDIPNIDPVDPKTDPAFQWQVGLMSGVNLLETKYQALNGNTDWADLKNSTEAGVSGTSYGLHTSLTLNKKWILGTGVEFNDMWIRFSYEDKENITVLKEDVLVRVVINSMQDTVSYFYADTTVNAVQTHTIRHHNNYKSFSFPLEFGFQGTTNKWTYGLSLGPVLHIHTSQVGRAFDMDSEISLFDTNGNRGELLDKKIALGLRASPFISYQLKGRYSLMLKSTLNWQSNTINDSAKLNLFQYNLNLGVLYKL